MKSRPESPAASYFSTATAANIVIRAATVRDEDFLYDTFDANLILAGILPVRMALTNTGPESLDLKRARFETRANETGNFKSKNPREAFKRLISYYGISIYSKSGYKESLEAFSAFALDVATPLEARQSREGLVFFFLPNDSARDGALKLVVKLDGKSSGTQGAVELALQ